MKKLSSNLLPALAAIFLGVAIALIHRGYVNPPKRTIVKEEVSMRDIVQHIVPHRSIKYNLQRTATGFYLKYRGKNFIITNKHVCGKKKAIVFGEYVGIVLKVSDKHDLCIVSSDRSEGLILAEDTPQPFEDIYLIGYPRGMGKVIRKGSIIEMYTINAPWLGMLDNHVEAWLISTITYPGNSGSPVVNKFGEVVGVLFAGSPSYVTEGFMVPLEDLKEFLSE